ncbi:MAG: PRD domain-containing protein [Candidatus Phlomobacter fragariae]
MSQSSIVFNVAKDNLDVETVTNKLISIIDGWLKAEGARTTDVQQKMLRSHVKAMVERAKTGDPLHEVEVSLFKEISPESIALAEKVVNTLPNLAYKEAYLLSVHFEVARSNS